MTVQLRRRPGGRRPATPCWPSDRSPTPRPRASRAPASRSTRRLPARSTGTARPTCPTSSPPVMSRGNSRSRRWPPCRDARWPSTWWAGTLGDPPPPQLRECPLRHLHRTRDRRRGPGRSRRLRRGPQDPGDQGALRGQRPGADRQRLRVGSSRSSPTRRPASSSAGRSSGTTPPELISVLALAVTGRLRVADIVEPCWYTRPWPRRWRRRPSDPPDLVRRRRVLGRDQRFDDL